MSPIRESKRKAKWNKMGKSVVSLLVLAPALALMLLSLASARPIPPPGPNGNPGNLPPGSDALNWRNGVLPRNAGRPSDPSNRHHAQRTQPIPYSPRYQIPPRPPSTFDSNYGMLPRNTPIPPSAPRRDPNVPPRGERLV